MNFFMFAADGFSMVGTSYYTLISYVVGLASFIVPWVLIMLSYQILCHRSVSVLESESHFVEFIWTFLPTILILILSFLNVSCFASEGTTLGYTSVKVLGRQWYWSYGLPGASGDLYDSVMGDFVNSVDKPLRLIKGDSYCLYVTSADVIHSFSIPFLTLKVDAIPGRVNQFWMTPDFYGCHVGYCSELCGAGHAYMPIVVEVVPPEGMLC